WETGDARDSNGRSQKGLRRLTRGLFSESWPHVWFEPMSAPAVNAVARPPRLAGNRQRVSPCLSVTIAQELFRNALARERNRADRFGEPFVLVLISLNSRIAQHSDWGHIFEALAAAKLDADLIGWFEQGSVLGVIRSLAGSDLREIANTLVEAV